MVDSSSAKKVHHFLHSVQCNDDFVSTVAISATVESFLSHVYKLNWYNLLMMFDAF